MIKSLATFFRDRYVALLLLLVLAFIVALELRQPLFFLWDDNVDRFLPFYTYNWRAVVENLTIPFFNFHQFAGQAYLGQGQNAVFYPPVYVAVLISKVVWGDNKHCIDLLVAAHLLVAAVGMYGFLRTCSVKQSICLLSALAWVTSPFIVLTSKGWVIMSYVAALLPLNFWALERFNKYPTLKFAFLLSIPKSLLFLQGNVQYLFMLMLFEVTYVALKFLSKQETFSRQWLESYLYNFLFFGGICAPLIFSMIYTQKVSIVRSGGVPYYHFINCSLVVSDFLKALMLQFRPNAIHGAGTQLFSFGLPLLLILFLMPINRWRHEKIGLVLLAVSILAFAFSTRAYGVFFHLPVFNFFRWPFKYYFLFLFFFIGTIAIIANQLTLNKGRSKRAILAFFAAGIACQLYVVFAFPSVTFMPFRMKDEDRAVIASYNISTSGRISTLWTKRSGDFNSMHRYLGFNFASMYGYYHLGGWDPMVSYINSQISLWDHWRASIERGLDSSLLKYLSKWGVQYLIAPSNEVNKKRLSQWPQLNLVRDDKEILIYENKESKPLAYSADGKPMPIQININSLELQPNGAEKLTVNIAPLPFFFMFVDGKPFGLVDANQRAFGDSGPLYALLAKEEAKIKRIFWRRQRSRAKENISKVRLKRLISRQGKSRFLNKAIDKDLLGAPLLLTVPKGAQKVSLLYIDLYFFCGVGIAVFFWGGLIVVTRKKLALFN